VSIRSFKGHKATVLIAVLALCCFVFAGTALAGVTVTEPSHILKADHTYNLTIEGSNLEVDLNTFCSAVPYDHPGFNGLIIDFPWTGPGNYNFESNNLTGAHGKQVPVYLTIEGNEYMVPVVPVVVEESADCNSPSVADRVYLVIERQSLDLDGNAKVTGFKIEGLQVLTPRTPSSNYNLCVRHTVENCFNPMCTVMEVVPTVEYLELEIVDDSCLVAGSTISVKGKVYSTEYVAGADRDCDEYAPWAGRNSWPVVICLMERISTTVCDEPVYTYAPLAGTDNAVWTMDPCGKNEICKDASSGAPLPCVAVSIDTNGVFNATLPLPAAGLGKDIVVFARTIEAKDNNEDSCIKYTATSSKVAAESIEDNANAIEEVEGQNALRKHIVWGLYPPACENHAWVGSDDVVVDIIPGAPFAIKGPVLPDQIEIANPMDPICCAEECTSYPIEIKLFDKYCNETKNVDSCEVNNAQQIKVDLKAYYLENGKEKLAGIFYDNDPCDENSEAKQLDHTFIPVGESVANKVYFMPTRPGLFNMQYSAIIDGKNKLWEQCGIEVNYNACLLEVTPLVESDGCAPGKESLGISDGWPIKISVHYDQQVPLRVEILDPGTKKPFAFSGGPDSFLVTWDTEAYVDADGYLEFEAEGQFGHGDYLNHPFGNVPYDPNKSDFFVYPVNACGETFTIKIVDEANRVKDEVTIGPLASATELVRVLEPSKWQVLSTPKKLAGDGDLLSLFDGLTPYNMALTYKNNQWEQILPVDELDPLYAYVINTQQNWCREDCGELCGKQLPIYAKYVFARATNPSLTMLPERLLTAGANLIGPSFNEAEIALPYELGQEYFEISARYKKAMNNCFSYLECCDTECYECDTPVNNNGVICPERLFQFDTLARLTATFCDGCSMIANYGGDSAGECRNSRGNLAFFTTAALGGNNGQSWLTDPLHFAFNGDGYLAYVNSAQTYTGAAQLELVNIAP